MSVFEISLPAQAFIPVSSLQTVKPTNKLLTQLQPDSLRNQLVKPDHEMNGLAIWLHYKRYLRLSSICLIIIGFQIVLCFTYYQMDHMENEKSSTILACAYSLHCLEVVLRLFIEKVRFERMQLIQKLDYNFNWEILKILLSIPLYPLPWLKDTTIEVQYTQNSGVEATYPFKINYLIIIISILHLAIVAVTTLILNTAYYSPRAQRISRIYQIHHHGKLYTVKCIIKDHPILAFALLSCFMWIFSTFALKIAEADVPVDGNKFLYYENCFWFVGITFTTVGYGDIYPVSCLGRFMVCFCCIWSTFNISVITFLLVTNLALNQHQHKSLRLLKNVDNTLARKQLSGQYIKIAVWRLWLNKKYGLNYVQTLKEKKIKSQLNIMRIAKKKSINVNDLTEQMQKQFDNALINVNYLHQNNKNLLDYISNKVILLQTKIPGLEEKFRAAKFDRSEDGSSFVSMISIKNNIPSQKFSIKNLKAMEEKLVMHRASIQLVSKNRRLSNFCLGSSLKEKITPMVSQDSIVEE